MSCPHTRKIRQHKPHVYNVAVEEGVVGGGGGGQPPFRNYGVNLGVGRLSPPPNLTAYEV